MFERNIIAIAAVWSAPERQVLSPHGAARDLRTQKRRTARSNQEPHSVLWDRATGNKTAAASSCCLEFDLQAAPVGPVGPLSFQGVAIPNRSTAFDVSQADVSVGLEEPCPGKELLARHLSTKYDLARLGAWHPGHCGRSHLPRASCRCQFTNVLPGTWHCHFGASLEARAVSRERRIWEGRQSTTRSPGALPQRPCAAIGIRRPAQQTRHRGELDLHSQRRPRPPPEPRIRMWV